MTVEWIKIRVDMFQDEKIRLIESMPEGDALIIIWLKFLVQAGRTNDGGYIYLREGVPYTPEMLSVILSKPIDIIELALKTFSEYGMITIDEKGIHITNWKKHQNIEGLDKIREQTRERVRKYREKKKQEKSQAATVDQANDGEKDCNVTCNVTVTHGNALDKEKEKEKEKEDISTDQHKGRSSDYTPEFEHFWSIYPRKEDKKRAFKLWQRRLTSKKPDLRSTVEEMTQAAINYKEQCEREGRDRKYIKKASTFLSDNMDFQDYIDDDKVVRLNKSREKVREREIAVNRFLAAGFDPDRDRELLIQWLERGADPRELATLRANG